MLFANREFGLNKFNKTEVCGLPTAEELRNSLANTVGSSAREQIALIFDTDTFVEMGAYTKRGISDFITTDKANEFESVITGYGAIDGKLAFAFVEDASRMGGVIDERHAKKIADIYSLAIKNGAPVVGIFNSSGTDVFEGTSALSAYGKIIKCVAGASGKIPQIAFVGGKCIGTAASIASMFDFTVKLDSALFYISRVDEMTKEEGAFAFAGSLDKCATYIRSLVSYLPSNSAVGVIEKGCSDNLNRMLGELDFGGDGLSVISTISDNRVFYEVSAGYAPELITAFATIGGVKCGVVANSFAVNDGRVTASGAKKVAKFINFCDSFSIPLVTLVDSLGLANSENDKEPYFAASVAKLGFAYASASIPMVTVIMGHAIGAAYVLLGSKSLGADIVYALDTAEIAALNAESGVAFAWDKYITEETTRESLVQEWKESVSSPVVAASSGEIDDIIGTTELRARVCSALLMLTAKGDELPLRRKVLPL